MSFIFKRLRMDKIFVIGILGIGALFTNYLYTFSGFVAYSTEDRIAAEIWHGIFIKASGGGDINQISRSLSRSQANLAVKYAPYIKSIERYKTIERFYVEELLILLLAVSLIAYLKRIQNTPG